MFDIEDLRKKGAVFIIALLTIILFFALYPYINAFFGALILFVLFQKFYDFIFKYLNNKRISAIIVIICTIFIIVLPLFFLVFNLAEEATIILKSSQKTILNLAEHNLFSNLFTGIDIESFLLKQIADFTNLVQRNIMSWLGKTAHILITIIMMYLLLYYMFINSNEIKKLGYLISPFNKKNTKELLNNFSKITHTIIMSSGLIALIEGFLFGILFWLFDFNTPILFGILATIFSFLPVIGPTILWIPSSIYLFITDDPIVAIIFVILGVIFSNIDLLFRPIIQLKIGMIHPLITFIGVFIGFSLFGTIGLIIGPLLLSYFFLVLKIFKNEFILSKNVRN
ncbi:MAG: AI-2E family transporter [Nanoarchaeota archaeon]